MTSPLTDSASRPNPYRRVFVLFNPVSGTDQAADIRQAFERARPESSAACEFHELGRDERIGDVVASAIARGCDLVVAAGGDGTVSAVANALAGSGSGSGSEVTLGIVPMGTANVLARELGIPIELEPACRLLAGEHATTLRIDAIRIEGACYFTQVGVGIDALMIRDTRREHKRRFGRVAYLWTAFTRLLGFQPRRFDLTTDGRPTRARASQVVVANCGILGQPPFRWGPDIRPDDGRLDLCIIRAKTLLDYLKLSWHVLTGRHRDNPDVRYLTARHSITIATRQPLPVQGDGEILGNTPVSIDVAPGAVAVIVPQEVEGGGMGFHRRDRRERGEEDREGKGGEG